MPRLIARLTQGSTMTASLWYAAMLTLLLSACHNPGIFSMSNEEEAPAISIKERPNPQEAYRILMTIKDAPGPFVVDPGSTQHDIINLQKCGRINRNTGMAFHINAHPEFEWKKISESEYEGIVYADQMVDEDYYGRGVCSWKFTFANASLSATGDLQETRFQPTIDAEEIAAGQSVTWYFWKERYLVNTPLPSNGKGFADFGQKNLDTVPVDRQHEFFTITLVPTDMQP